MMYPTARLVFDRKKVATSANVKNPKKGLIQIEVSFQRKRKFFSTGVKVFAGQYSEDKGIINRPDLIILNETLQAQMEAVREYINNIIRNRTPFDWIAFETYLRARETDGVSFVDWVHDDIEQRNDLRQGTKRTHKKIVQSLEDFGGFLSFADVTLQNIKAYDNWLHKKYTNTNTIWSYNKMLCTYINRAIADGRLKENPYNQHKIVKVMPSQGKFLTEEEFEKIRTVEIPNEALRKARDLFVFQSYTGLAYSDLALFDWSKVIERDGKYILQGVRQKTGEPYYIVLLSPAMAILKAYNYKLPITNIQKTNEKLKAVAAIAKIDKLISTHWARRTAGYWMLNKGMPIEVVSKVLGHSNTRITEQVYAKILNKTIENAFDALEEKL